MPRISLKDYIMTPTVTLLGNRDGVSGSEDALIPMTIALGHGAVWRIDVEDGRYISDTVLFGQNGSSATPAPFSLDLSGLTSSSGVDDVRQVLKRLEVSFQEDSSIISHSVSFSAGVRVFSFSRSGRLEAIGPRVG